MTDDEAAIRQVVETWMAASRKGDLETVLGLMTDDVVFMVPGKAPFGKETFAAASKGMGETRIDGDSDIVERLGLYPQPHRHDGDAAGWRAGAALRLYADAAAQGRRRALAAGEGCEFAGGVGTCREFAAVLIAATAARVKIAYRSSRRRHGSWRLGLWPRA